MSDVAIAPVPLWRLFDVVGKPLAGGLLFTCVNNSYQPLTVFKDPGMTVPWSNPIVLDGDGMVHRPIYQPSNTLARYGLNSADNTRNYWIVDNVPPNIGSVNVINEWTIFRPTWMNTGSAPNQLLDGALTGRFRYTGLTTVEITILLTFGQGTVSGPGPWLLGNLPGVIWSYDPMPVHAYDTSASAAYAGVAVPYAPQIIGLTDGLSPSGYFGPTRPFVWGPGDFLRVSGMYPSAPPRLPLVFQGPQADAEALFLGGAGPTFLGNWTPLPFE